MTFFINKKWDRKRGKRNKDLLLKLVKMYNRFLIIYGNIKKKKTIVKKILPFLILSETTNWNI